MSRNVENVTVEACNVFWGDIDLGLLEGDISVSTEETGVDITAHQEGGNVLDMIRTGKNAGVTLTLKENVITKLQGIIKAGGSESTPAAEVSTVLCLAATTLNSKYLTFWSADNAVQYYAWFNVNSTGVDPLVTGATAIPVALATGATAAQVATALAAAIDASADFVSTASGALVTITNVTTGPATDIAAGNSGLTVAVLTQGIGTVVGWGRDKDFKGMLADSEKLVLHPMALPETDLTRDLAFWKAYPLVKSITYSGENPKLVELEFKVFPDPSRQDSVRLFVMGDHR